MTATLVDDQPTTREDAAPVITTTRDPEQAAHIVRVPDDLHGLTTPQAYVLAARVEGVPVQALCGHTWVPSRDPRALPVCETCLEIYRYDPFGRGRDDKPED